MVSEFDPEAFKAQLKEELLADNWLMLRELIGEVIKLIKENQPTPPTGPVDLDIELLVRNREENDRMVLADSVGQKNLVQTEDVE